MLVSHANRWSCAGCFAICAVSLGCQLDAELGSYAEVEADASTSADDSETDAAANQETGEGEAGDGDGDGDGEGGLCVIDGEDSVCDVCLKHLCCAQLDACDGEVSCFCMLDCLFDSDPVTCAMSCTPGQIYLHLVQCQAVNCAEVCT